MSRPANKVEMVRLNLAIPETVRKRLEVLTVLSESASMSETLRRSLAVYELLTRGHIAGSEVIIRDRKGVERIVLLTP